MTVDSTLTSLRQIKADLNNRFRQRQVVVETMLASMLARELVLLLGPRGEAKTAIVEALSGYISDGSHFSVGLAKSSTPDDILGGVDVVALQAGQYRRRTEGFLPNASTFLLDEGFKSNNPTLQALLRVLSEREFQGVKIPALFGAIASNELPAELRGQKLGRSADLGPFEDSLLAFWDRFFHKVTVEPLTSGGDDWLDVVFGGVTDSAIVTRVTVAEIEEAQREVDSVTIPQDVVEAMSEFAQELAAGQAGGVIHVSTRTWRKAVRMLKAHALLDGRRAVCTGDMRWLEHALWTTPDQRETLREALARFGAPGLAEARAIEQRVSEFTQAYASQHITLDASGGLVVTESKAPPISHFGVQPALCAFYQQQITELDSLMASSGGDKELARVRDYCLAEFGKVKGELDARMRKL